MKKTNYTFLSIFFFLLPFIVNGQKLADIKITGQYNDLTLVQIFDEIESNYSIHFYFNPKRLPDQTFSYTFEKTPLKDVLKKILEDNGLAFMDYSNYAIVADESSRISREYSKAFYISQYESAIKKKNKRANQLETLIVGDSLNPNANGKVKLSGFVKETNKSETIIGATLYIEALSIAAITDADGKYTLEVPIGNHIVTLQSIGYKKTEVLLKAYNDGTVDFELGVRPVKLNEVVVAAQKDDSNIRSTQIGVTRLSTKTIKELPSFLGETDVVKSLLMLPGVSSVGEGASGFNVRGGSIDQNLILLDDALIFNSSHVLGFFSIFNADVVKNVSLYKGNIPAQYGGRLSSVLDIELKEGDTQEMHGAGGIGIVSGRFTLEGPLSKGKTSFIAGVRASYSDWMLRLVRIPEIRQSSTFFYDANLKITHRFKDKSSLSLSGYTTYDRFRYAQDFGYGWNTQTANATFRKIINNQFSSTTSAIYGNYTSSFFDPEGSDAFSLSNGIQYYKLKQTFFLSPNNHEIHAGAELTHYKGKPEILEPYQNKTQDYIDKVNKEQGRELGVFVNDVITINDKLSFSIGLRYSYYQNLGERTVYTYDNNQPKHESTIIDSTYYGKGEIIQNYGGFEPRLSMKIGLNPSSSIKFSLNRLWQYIHLISNTTAATPVDIWQVSNPHIPPTVANKFSIGYFKNFDKNQWQTSLELYYSAIPTVVEYKDLPTLLLNDFLETELIRGKGKAYGGELSIKRTVGKLSGWIAYTYNRSLVKVQGRFPEETINNGAWFPSNYDKPHNLSLVAKVKVNRRQTFSANFTYNTGRPITVPVSNYVIGGVIVPNYSLRNSARIPNYHRLDLSYTFDRNKITTSKYKGSLTFSMYNVYFRKNAFSIFFKRSNDRYNVPAAYRLAVLGTAFPAVTYNFRF